MKTFMKVMSAVLAVSLLAGTAGAAFADPRNGDRDTHRELMREAQLHEFTRGERFIPARGYTVVHDWRGMRLHRPSFNAHWVRVGAEFLLISNQTGGVIDVVIAR